MPFELWRDFFVSYAHGPPLRGFDGEGGDLLRRWTRRLVDRLEAEILLSLGTKDPDKGSNYWMDRRLRGNQPLTDTLKEEVEASALLVVVMSNFSLQSSWCEDEVGWFRARIGRGPRRISRENIFVVRAMPTDEARWPAGLRRRLLPIACW